MSFLVYSTVLLLLFHVPSFYFMLFSKCIKKIECVGAIMWSNLASAGIFNAYDGHWAHHYPYTWYFLLGSLLLSSLIYASAKAISALVSALDSLPPAP